MYYKREATTDLSFGSDLIWGLAEKHFVAWYLLITLNMRVSNRSRVQEDYIY